MELLNLIERLQKLKEKVAEFPQEPGVYLMKSQREKIIYVGKAKRVRSRVRSYLGKNIESPKTQLLVRNIYDIEYILTATEAEALLLEASLIKKHRPRYNIRLKDDKAYPYIRLSMADMYPRFYLSRRAIKDGSMYFGPYSNGYVVRETIKFLNQNFQIRDCRDHFMKQRKRPCMTYQIGACSAPCVGKTDSIGYRRDVQRAIDFLQQDSSTIVEELEQKMKQLAAEEKFELAAKVRDGMQAIARVMERQAVVNSQSQLNQDVIGYHGDERGTLVETLHIRLGRVIGQRNQFFPLLNAQDESEDPREWLVSFINQYYLENIVPDEILLPVDFGHEIIKLLQQVFAIRGYHRVVIRYPTENQGHELLEMAHKNAASHFTTYLSKSEKKQQGLELIQSKFGLKDVPYRIECYDISHFQGAESVGAQVVFEDGVPSKDHYRRYKLKTETNGDDYGALREVLGRRFRHDEWDEPDLILIDGGKGQLNSAIHVLEKMGKSYVPIASIAKERTKRNFLGKAVEKSLERFYLPNRANPVTFSEGSPAFRILTGLRDEAHRFAIEYHRRLRESASIHSQFDDIPGVGEVLKKRILNEFPSLADIKAAGVEGLAGIKGIHSALAEEIYNYLFAPELPD